MNDHRQIKFRLREAEMYLQFLQEDIDSMQSINEDTASKIEQLIKEVTKKLQESGNILSREIKDKRK